MKENFLKYMPEVLKYEGTEFEEHPNDPGGPTKFGITIYDLGIREKLSVSKNWSKLRTMVKNLTKEEAIEIYRVKYWNKMKCDDLPSGIDIIICDHGINCGPVKSIKIAQKIIGVEVDGKIGKKTINAIKLYDPKKFIEEFSNERREYYKSLSHFKTFGKGWLNRTNYCEKFANSLV